MPHIRGAYLFFAVMTLDFLLSAPVLLAWGTYFVGVASPGPSILAIMSVAMNEGRRAALTFAGGVACGAFFWAIMATLGVSAIIASHPPLMIAIKLAGGCYFVWLAWRAARSALRATAPLALKQSASSLSRPRLYLRGLLMHLTNPKAVLIWMSIVAMGANTGGYAAARPEPGMGQGSPTVQASGALGVTAGCMVIGLTVFATYAVLFSTSRARRIYAACRRWLDGAMAFMFLIAGVSLLTLQV